MVERAALRMHHFMLCHSLPQGMFLWAFNGVGLGLLLPNAQVRASWQHLHPPMGWSAPLMARRPVTCRAFWLK